MFSWKKIIPEFWNHKELVVGKKGQQYIFRNKWFLLIQATCVLTLLPLAISTILFYKNNKTETITDLLLETAVLSKGAGVDVEIFFNQYLTTLRMINAQYSGDNLKKRDILKTILENIGKTNILFSSLNIIDQNGSVVSWCGNDFFFNEHKQIEIDLTRLNKGRDYFIGKIIGRSGKIYLFVSLRLVHKGGDLFMMGIINKQSTDSFLNKLKFKDVMDIYIIDRNGTLLTTSTYFGKPGSKTILPQSSVYPSSEILTNSNEKKKGGEFLFLGVSKISNTNMLVGILLSNHSFEVFMSRIRVHIVTMISLSVLFVSITILLLVTYIIQTLYRADKVRQIYLTNAARNSKMASIGQLAAGVAHEINNPLAIINEKAGLLQDLFTFIKEYKDDDRLLSAVESIIGAVERAGTITHRLLGFARKTDSSVKAVDMNETVQEVLDFIKKEAEYKSINLNIQISHYLPQIITDRGKLQQILINLVNNAIAALPENGTLTVRVRNNIKNENIEIYVEDNGCGISQKNQKKIFEPFFTTKSEIGGTGLGLSLTYGLIRDLHGTLELESSVGIGTTFIISLPYEIN